MKMILVKYRQKDCYRMKEMIRRSVNLLVFLHLAALFFSGSSLKGTSAMSLSYHDEKKLVASVSLSTRQMDVTTPITTVPTPNPSSFPSITNPMLNPTDSNPDSPTVMNPANPIMTPLPMNSPASSSTRSWCIASHSASQAALQVALDYACGHGGGDCAAIQPGGRCYNPNTIRDHASYAFNSYYQKNPIPTSCNFGGTAVTTSTDPSFGTCQFASTSTTSSVLNTTNSSGSRVFGAGRPLTPSTSTAAALDVHSMLVYLMLVLAVIRYTW